MVGGQSGPWFYPKRGVHQGAPLSMILYIFYINDLLKDLSNCTSGLRIRSLRLTSPSHADDIAILALFKKSLNALLDIAYRYSLKWRYSYNMSKTTLIVWGPDLESNKDVVFGNCVLSKSDKCKHMGVTLHNDPKLSTELCSKRIGAGRKILLAARGIGSTKVPVAPNVLSKLYWSVAIPKMLYGVEVTPISEQCIESLCKAHRHHANIVQNLPQCTPKPAPLASLGWVSMWAYIAYMKIMFLFRVLCLPHDSVYRILMILSIQQCCNNRLVTEKMESPVGSIMKYIKYCGLQDAMSRCVNFGEWSMINVTKRFVKQRIMEIETKRWKATTVMYKDLWLYNENITRIRMHIWWEFVKDYPVMLKKYQVSWRCYAGANQKVYKEI